ncbi:hypothetical protein COY07_01080 [Candidatus Peregrinibacteria bacterium CG_4_10_14_0_2_um_filter_43_11]|nr:MAG: hypothetical protein COY07_01080 [Candidatus Peregrinibacteria bacterium CG_4_10_14_0_2_um_filter_43_11]
MNFSIKKLCSVLIISVLFFNSTALAFDDVPQDSPYFYAAELLRRSGVVSDVKLFHPEMLITRAEFIKYLVILNAPDFKPRENIKLPFKDTDNNAWYAPYFDEAIRMGILSDRQEIVLPFEKLNAPNALALLFHSKSIPIPTKHVGEIFLKDVKKNLKVAPLVMRALQMELVTPEKEDYFGIYKKINRGEAAHMIYRMELVDIAPPNFTTPEQEAVKNTSDYRLQKFIDSWNLIHKSYIDRDSIDDEKLTDAAIKAMADALGDPYSTYLDRIANASFSDDLDGEIEGIGAMIGLNEEKEIIVITPLVDSPAQKAGLKAGDIIKEAEGVVLKGLNLQEAVSHIKGPKGTSVKLVIDRGGQALNFNVVRDVIKINALEYGKNGTDVMYIKLTQFNQNAAREFKAVSDAILNDPNTKGIVLDMRDNPGGLLDSAISILQYFLKKDAAIVKIKYNNFTQTQLSGRDGELGDYPVVVLINKGSASASEIVSGALKDYGIATVLGETSFGKGTVQEVNFFRDQSSIKLTIAKWLTPLGHSIQGNGITPDIAVQNVEDSTIDRQLNRALEEIRKTIHP